MLSPGRLQALRDAASAAFGGVDVWVNNAGVSIERLPLWEQRGGRDLAAVVGTNLTGALLASKTAIANMLRQGHGELRNTEGFGSDGATQRNAAIAMRLEMQDGILLAWCNWLRV